MAGNNSTVELVNRAFDFCNSLDAFFELAERELDEHNNTDLDKMKFLMNAAKAEMFKFSEFACKIESDVNHA